MEDTVHSVGEEIANSISHGVGAALGIAGLALLTLRAASTGSTLAIVSCAIFGASIVLLYLSSTLYHSLGHTRANRVLRSLDHGSIYVLIAGTYTPFSPSSGCAARWAGRCSASSGPAHLPASSSSRSPPAAGEWFPLPCIWQWDGPASLPSNRCITGWLIRSW